MERWSGSLAVVTGASVGIGAKVVEKFVHAGINVVAIARRVELIEKQKKQLAKEKGKVYPVQCDISENDKLVETFEWIEKNLGPISIIVNNAAVWPADSLLDGETDEWRKTLEINVIALCTATKLAVKSMEKAGISGHIVQISSILGHYIPHLPKNITHSVYTPSKFALTALTEATRVELIHKGSKIKITNISPGFVDTQLFRDFQSGLFSHIPMLKPDDIADAVVYAVGTPPSVQVHDVIIRAVGALF